MEDRKYVKLFCDMLIKGQRLKDAEFGRLVRAALTYKLTGEEIEMTGNEVFLWDGLKMDIDRSNEAYQKKVETNRANGQKGGRPTKPKETQENPENPVGFSETQETQNAQEQRTKIEEQGAKSEENTGDIGASPQTPRRAFIPPTPSDVREYCLQKGYDIDPERFCDYYASQGWRLSNGLPIKDWQACARQWVRRDKERGVQARPQSGGNPFADIARELEQEEQQHEPF